MIVGPTGGGKTVVLDTLKAARLKAEGVVVKYYVINPKAQPLNELYGVMDPVTRDWTDGVLSRLFRELNEPLPKAKEGKEMRWIIYDGDVDAVCHCVEIDASRDLGTAALGAAQTRPRPPRDRMERATPHPDPNKPQIEAQVDLCWPRRSGSRT